MLRSELHIHGEIRAPLKIEVIDTQQRRAADERRQRFPFVPMAVVVLSRKRPASTLAASMSTAHITGQTFRLACFDRRLHQAAQILKLKVLP